MGCIYRAYCPASGKTYVGQTRRESWRKAYGIRFALVRGRKRDGKSMSHWERAMFKYGPSGFHFRDLMQNVPNDQLDGLEKFFIAYLGTLDHLIGYNTEVGGRRKKEFSSAAREARNRTLGKPALWYHRDHGEVAANTLELVRRHGVEYISMAAVRRGRHRSHRGWICLSAPRYRSNKGMPGVWRHEQYGEFHGGTREMVLCHPDLRLIQSQLATVRCGSVPHHKQWRYVRELTDEEEIVYRRWTANQPHLDLDMRVARAGAVQSPDTVCRGL